MNSPVSFHILNTTHQNTSKTSLAHGERVNATVARHAGDGSFVLRIKGAYHHVRSEIPLKIGDLLRLRVVRNGNSITLVQERTLSQTMSQTMSQTATPGGVGASGDATQSVLSALIRSGMPILPENQKVIMRILEKYKRTDYFFARLIALAVDKGMKPSDSFIEELLSAFDDSARDRDSHSQREHGSPKQSESPMDETEDSDEADFRETLRVQCKAGDRDGGALQLFNHVGASHDMWQIVPYHVQKDAWHASGTIRIRKDHAGDLCGFVLEVREQDATSYFSVRKVGDRLVAIVPPRENDKFGAHTKLVEKLRNIGIEIDDNNLEETFDGFSNESTDSATAFDVLV
jgi:hypothetical protein